MQIKKSCLYLQWYFFLYRKYCQRNSLNLYPPLIMTNNNISVRKEEHKPRRKQTLPFLLAKRYMIRNHKKGSANPAVFTITNTGNRPLIIHRVSASCGCTNVEWEKQPIEQGKTATVRVTMVPDETGYFRKTIDVHCNAEESPVRLAVMGRSELKIENWKRKKIMTT